MATKEVKRDEARHLRTSGRGRSFIKDWEGEHLKAYRDVAGIWTIGVGHTGPEVREGMVISSAQSDAYLKGDLAEAELEIWRCVKVKLAQHEFDALVSWQFNCGALRSSTLLKRLNAGRYDLVDDEMRRWNKATNPKTGKKVVVRGPVARRLSESELWAVGDYRTRNETTAFWESNVVPLEPETREQDQPPAARPSVQGGAATAVGVAGTALTDSASMMSMSLQMSQTLQLLFVMLTMAGVGLTVYAAVKNNR